ncbi:MAG: hypothetical protein JXA54_15975 [Candidatus Heimdallarchaeota archaeon]|nr:hypothetical protein [Candidatus Heimdallarchaeota archaeon]
MIKEKDSLLFKIQGHIKFIFIIEIIFLSLGIISIIIGFIGLIIRDYGGLVISFTGAILFLILILYFIYPNYTTTSRIWKLFLTKDETSLIEIAQKIDNNTIVALIALYDLKSEDFKPLLTKYLASHKYQSGLLSLLLKEISNDYILIAKSME